MGRYIINRLLQGIPLLLFISIILFALMMNTGDPVATMGGRRVTRQADYERLRRQLGLDKPLYVQYGRYLLSVLRGDLGTSIKTRQPIVTELRTYLPATLELVFVAMIIAILIGLPMGVLSGANKGGWIDQLSRVISVAGVSVPTFFLGLVLQLIFFARLGLLPIGGRVSNEIAINYPVQQITGFYTLDTLFTGNSQAFRDVLWHLILPAFTLSLYDIGLITRMTRSSMIEVLNEKYILAARVSGLPRRTILFSLALKNAFIPTLTVIGLSFVYALTGSLLVEVIFAWPGLGTYITSAVLSLDFPVIVSVTLVVTVFYIAINLLLDMIQASVDPRVTLS